MNFWGELKSDVRLSLRRLREAPWFACICVATLALGIGGNTAVFTLIDRVMLKPLPVLRPAELYRVGDTDACCVNSGLMGSFSLFSYDLYLHLRDSAPQFRELAAFQANTRAVTIGRPDLDAPGETLAGAFVSGNYVDHESDYTLREMTQAVYQDMAGRESARSTRRHGNTLRRRCRSTAGSATCWARLTASSAWATSRWRARSTTRRGGARRRR